MSDTRVTRRTLLKSGVAATTAAGFTSLTPLQAHSSADATNRSNLAGTDPEPNLEIAKGWWTELRNKWTPVGWKYHQFRFNVFYDASISADPRSGTNDKKLADQGVKLRFIDIVSDDRQVKQGWRDDPAPVLWSDWVPVSSRVPAGAPYGAMVRQKVFAHTPGAREIESGKEPLFAWIRVSITDICEGLPIDPKLPVKINIDTSYSRALTTSTDQYDPTSGFRILEPDGRVRLAVALDQECEAKFEEKPDSYIKSERNRLTLSIDMEIGASVDFLLPFFPVEPDVCERELALGFDGALKEANAFWSNEPATAARVDVPEEHVTQFIRRNAQFNEVVTQKTDDGYFHLLTASTTAWHPRTQNSNMMFPLVQMLEVYGYHEAGARFLKYFKDTQGKWQPPSAYLPSKGYLGGPAWLNDHGAILWAMAEHGLLTGDQDFIEDFLPAIIEGCEWIQRARKVEGHGGQPGIMPAGSATDTETRMQAVWNDACMYKGLRTAVRLLKRIQHPRAEEFAVEAEDYRKAFLKAIQQKTKTMPVWTDRQGGEHHLVPTNLADANPFETRHAFYLDRGPLVLVWGGLMDAGHELMQSNLLWFREGPPQRFYHRDSNWLQIVCLDHEVSSCENIWSWNVYHSWQLADRMKYFEGMYSLITAAASQQTYSTCESRQTTRGRPTLQPGPYMVRLAAVDDQIAEGELHLLRMMPLAWLAADREAIFENMPTYYGPVDLQVKLASAGKELDVSFTPHFRTPPEKVVLHVPPAEGLQAVRLNGKNLNWDRKQNYLTIA